LSDPSFEANEIQLQGPTPSELYHRYVDFKWFVAPLFTASGIRGKLLNKAIHKQHARVYAYDKRCKSGKFEYDPVESKPRKEVTRKFLELAHWDQGGRQFTYVLTLNSMLRFCETGENFTTDFMSKHMGHADADVYVAFAGEFLIRRIDPHAGKGDGGGGGDTSGKTHPPDHLPGGPPDEEPPRHPKHYELVIDQDSGTYRPKKELLPVLKGYLERNLPGLKITVLHAGSDELKEIRKQQAEAKKREGEGATTARVSVHPKLQTSKTRLIVARLALARGLIDPSWRGGSESWNSRGPKSKPRREICHSGSFEFHYS
jgi:hypothetical protein